MVRNVCDMAQTFCFHKVPNTGAEKTQPHPGGGRLYMKYDPNPLLKWLPSRCLYTPVFNVLGLVKIGAKTESSM